MRNSVSPKATPTSRRMHLLDKESILLKGKPLRYRLYEHPSTPVYYIVEVTFGEEVTRAVAGTDFFAAVRLFERLVIHTVTPCTLTDVVADWRRGALQKTRCGV